MQVAYVSNKGLVRPNNEDSFFVDEENQLFIVADGLGGHQAGEVASKMAVEITSKYILEKIIQQRVKYLTIIEEAIIEANGKIFYDAQINPYHFGMGTTVDVALIKENDLWIGHVGDSRIYLIRKEKIFQLTEDHTVVQEYINQGVMTKEMARVSPYRNVLSRVLGFELSFQIDLKKIALEKNDKVLLCTDGLTEALEEEEIFKIIQQKTDINEMCSSLIEEANERGGRDNTTLILIVL